ncbi:hypothetical protein L1887_42605 [Cichorium endivia]|nr:hypothetical protein L1887_42605 [Cichorium endivia]
MRLYVVEEGCVGVIDGGTDVVVAALGLVEEDGGFAKDVLCLLELLQSLLKGLVGTVHLTETLLVLTQLDRELVHELRASTTISTSSKADERKGALEGTDRDALLFHLSVEESNASLHLVEPPDSESVLSLPTAERRRIRPATANRICRNRTFVRSNSDQKILHPDSISDRQCADPEAWLAPVLATYPTPCSPNDVPYKLRAASLRKHKGQHKILLGEFRTAMALACHAECSSAVAIRSRARRSIGNRKLNTAWASALLLLATSTGADALFGIGEKRFKYEGLINAGSLGLDQINGQIAAWGDWNGDQFVDAIVVDADRSTASIHVWDHSDFGFKRSPAATVQTPAGQKISNVVAADINYDGRLDLLVMSQNPASSSKELSMQIFLGEEDGSGFQDDTTVVAVIDASPAHLYRCLG